MSLVSMDPVVKTHTLAVAAPCMSLLSFVMPLLHAYSFLPSFSSDAALLRTPVVPALVVALLAAAVSAVAMASHVVLVPVAMVDAVAVARAAPLPMLAS
jgi:hypothetical protein